MGLLPVAAGSGPFGYSWFYASTNLVQSGTNSTLMLPGVSTSDTGYYMVIVTNAYGSVTSQVATLTVGFPPIVTTQPGSQTGFPGTNVSFTVTAGGTAPFTYQWQFNGTNLPNNIITTVAGDGYGATTSGRYAGDGGTATNASLYYPQGVGFDAAGNMFIADNNNNRVRKVDSSGTTSTVAGGGSGGDGGAATNASLNRPNNVAFDATGSLYIADILNNRIRKVDTNGIIATVAGNGTYSESGDGGAATNAGIYWPASVALDAAGNFYIAALYYSHIRKVNANGIISTVVGSSAGYSGDGGAATSAKVNGPQGVALDADGNLYIADTGNSRIRKVDTSGIISTVAGKSGSGYSGDGGAATNATLKSPWGVALDAFGDLYIADLGNNRIRKVDTNGIITTVAGTSAAGYSGDGGAATNASLHNPACVALDAAGNLYIADWLNNRIREVHLAGYPTLTVSNVSVGNAGNYTVVVTSPYGSATSEVAVLTITIPRTPPQIITGDGSFGFQSNQFGFNLNGAVGQTIVVDGSTDLVGWAPLFTNTVVGNPFYFYDPAWTNYPQRFYRARLP
jgi:sugar lactone lactonase YvrE